MVTSLLATGKSNVHAVINQVSLCWMFNLWIYFLMLAGAYAKILTPDCVFDKLKGKLVSLIKRHFIFIFVCYIFGWWTSRFLIILAAAWVLLP